MNIKRIILLVALIPSCSMLAMDGPKMTEEQQTAMKALVQVFLSYARGTCEVDAAAVVIKEQLPKTGRVPKDVFMKISKAAQHVIDKSPLSLSLAKQPVYVRNCSALRSVFEDLGMPTRKDEALVGLRKERDAYLDLSFSEARTEAAIERFGNRLSALWDDTEIEIAELFTMLRNEVEDKDRFDLLMEEFESIGMPRNEVLHANRKKVQALDAIRDARDIYLRLHLKEAIKPEAQQRFGKVLADNYRATDMDITDLFTLLRDAIKQKDRFDRLMEQFEFLGMPKNEQLHAYRAIFWARNDYLDGEHKGDAAYFYPVLHKNYQKTGLSIDELFAKLNVFKKEEHSKAFARLRIFFEGLGMRKEKDTASKGKTPTADTHANKSPELKPKFQLGWWLRRAVPTVITLGGIASLFFWYHKSQSKGKTGTKAASAH